MGTNKTPESYKKVLKILLDIANTREKVEPESQEWFNYIEKIFQNVGFHVQKENQRIYILYKSPEENFPKAVLVLVKPRESFEELIPGLSWDNFIQYVACFYQTDWVIVTDGLKLKVLGIEDQAISRSFFCADFDEIIRHQIVIKFYDLLKTFQEIKMSKRRAGVLQSSSPDDPEKNESLANAKQSVIMQAFMNELLEASKKKTSLHARVKVTGNNALLTSAGIRGFKYAYYGLPDSGTVSLMIDRADKNWNKSEFMRLHANKIKIEERFGAPLEWHLLPNQKSSYIRYTISGFNLRDLETWADFQEELIDAMIRLEASFSEYLAS